MEVILEIFAAAAVGGVSRARRQSRPSRYVKSTSWLTVAVVATVLVGLAIALITVLFARAAIGLASANDMLSPVLGMVVIPVALAELCVAIGTIGWLVGLVRKLIAQDASARVELAGAGMGALLLALLFDVLFFRWLAVLFLVPAVTALGVSLASPVWQEQESWPDLGTHDITPEPPA